GPNRFFRNRGNGTFEGASDWGGSDEGPSTASVFFDADGDSDLDLYVANYVVYDLEAPPNEGRPCDWKGQAVFCGPWGTVAAPDSFYENRDGRLTPAAEIFGFSEPEPAYGLGAVTGDFDNDGDTDLYVANDSVPNFLFENLGGGRFEERAMEYGADRRGDGVPQAGMGVDFGDVDNDGRFEFFVTNFASDTNTLYHNLEAPGGGAIFTDVTNSVGLGEPSYAMLSWGTRIVDLDHDGWQDIVVASGHIYPQADASGLGTSYAQPNQVYRNLGPDAGGRTRFREESARAGEGFQKIASSRGLVTADFDDDGDIDLLFVEMDGPPTLLRNDTEGKGRFIGFALRGAGRNRDAIGARLIVEDSEGVVRHRERTSGGSYLSTSDPRLVFGLGTAEGPLRSVAVRWPSGRVDVHRQLEIDRYWILEEGASSASAVR
ncbi:MAG: CRTAC1 family protein, partial [Vicinamibacteria bacterium]